jgi:hypothetical protein
MLRLVLLLLYLIASPSTSPQAKQSAATGYVHPRHPGAVPVFAKAGGGYDPNGTPLSSAPTSVDAGGGTDPDGAR